MRTSISVEREIAEELRFFAEKKHGFIHGAVKAEAEKAIKQHISGG